jgi:hypothetical protein
MSEHTRTPYRAKNRNWRNEPTQYDWYISGDKKRGYATSVCIVIGNETAGDIPEKTAKFICKACNCHDDLVKALDDLLRNFEPIIDTSEAESDHVVYKAATAALKKARKK